MAQVDPRILQANERTLLGWIRTGVSLLTFGFVIAKLGVWLRGQRGSEADLEVYLRGTARMGALFALLGLISNLFAIRRYLISRKAILANQEIPVDSFPVVFASIATLLGGIISGYLLTMLH
jgi:putative membrane protein